MHFSAGPVTVRLGAIISSSCDRETLWQRWVRCDFRRRIYCYADGTLKVYLDIDGVLIGTDRDKSYRASLADHAVPFLEFVVANFEVYWLAPECRGDATGAVAHLVRHAKLSDRERLMSAASKVRATNFDDDRTEALPEDGDFVWFDNEPSEGELDCLRRCGWMDRWQWIDTREEPEDLLRARKWLQARVVRKV